MQADINPTRGKDKLKLLAFGLGLGLAFAELSCRALFWLPGASAIGPSDVFGLTYETRPYARWKDPFEDLVYENNRWGMRGPDFPLEKAPNERRLLVLGDSIAHGTGVPYEGIAPRLVERELNRRLRDGTTVRVVNLGTSSYNVWDYYFSLEGKGWSFKPDGVLLFLCMNDAAPKALALPVLEPGRPLPASFRIKHLLLKSRLVYFLLYKANLRGKLAGLWGLFFHPASPLPTDAKSRDVVSTLDARSLEAIRKNQPVEGWSLDSMKDAFREMFTEENWLKALGVLEAIHRSTQAHGVFFRVVIFPVGLQVPPGYRDDRPQRLIRRYLREHGIEHVDLLERYRRATVREGRIFVHGDLLHPNAIGHRIAAEEILRSVAKEYPLK